MGEDMLQNRLNSCYLGYDFQADGDDRHAVEVRMARARSRFNQLHHIWRSTKLPEVAKLRLYESGVCSVLAYGCEAWKLTSKLMASLRGWNARCLALITGSTVRDETVDPRAALTS